MATLLYSYKKPDGTTGYIGAASASEAKKLSGASSVTQVQGFSSEKASPTATTPERTAEIASQSFVTPENKAAIQKAFPTTTVTQTPTTTKTQKPVIPGTDAKNTLSSFGSVEEAQERITNFSTAVNSAIDLARQQRKDRTLDFLDGVVPTGALPATSFANVLSAFNSSAAPIESGIANAALDAIAQQEQNKFDMQQQAIEDQKAQESNIRDLALSLVSEGVDASTVDAILKAGTYDTAISMAAGAIQSLTSKNDDTVVENVGGQLVSYSASDPNNTVKVLFTPKASGSTGGGGAGGGTTITTPGGGGTTTSTALSPEVEQVLDGVASLDSFTPSKQTEVRNELYKLGFGSTTPPDWFKEYIQNELRMSLAPQAVQIEWNNLRAQIFGEGVSKEGATTSTGGAKFEDL